MGKYLPLRDSLLFGLLIPLTFARILPAGVALGSALLFVPAFMLGMITAVFLKEWKLGFHRALITAIGSLLLGWLWIWGYAEVPLWICLILQILFLAGEPRSLWAILPFGIGVMLPAPAGALAGVLTITLSALSLQNALPETRDWHPPLCSLGIALGILLL